MIDDKMFDGIDWPDPFLGQEHVGSTDPLLMQLPPGTI